MHSFRTPGNRPPLLLLDYLVDTSWRLPVAVATPFPIDLLVAHDLNTLLCPTPGFALPDCHNPSPIRLIAGRTYRICVYRLRFGYPFCCGYFLRTVNVAHSPLPVARDTPVPHTYDTTVEHGFTYTFGCSRFTTWFWTPTVLIHTFGSGTPHVTAAFFTFVHTRVTTAPHRSCVDTLPLPRLRLFFTCYVTFTGSPCTLHLYLTAHVTVVLPTALRLPGLPFSCCLPHLVGWIPSPLPYYLRPLLLQRCFTDCTLHLLTFCHAADWFGCPAYRYYGPRHITCPGHDVTFTGCCTVVIAGYDTYRWRLEFARTLPRYYATFYSTTTHLPHSLLHTGDPARLLRVVTYTFVYTPPHTHAFTTLICLHARCYRITFIPLPSGTHALPRATTFVLYLPYVTGLVLRCVCLPNILPDSFTHLTVFYSHL